MKSDARARIDAHHLMRAGSTRSATVRIDEARAVEDVRSLERRSAFVRKLFFYGLLFVGSFIFTTGFMVLSILLWVSPGNLIGLVAFGVMSAAVFVGTFAGVRMHLVYTVLRTARSDDDDAGSGHHLAKSVAYGLVALVAAVFLAGILINAADAFTVR